MSRRFSCPARAARPQRRRPRRVVAFYCKLFGTEPAKLRPGYANFAIAEPPLKLVLIENPGQGGASTTSASRSPGLDAVDAEQTRLAQPASPPSTSADTTCCYAKQDKFWVEGAPNGEQWEIYTVLADSPTFWGDDTAAAARWAASGAQEGCCAGDVSAEDEPAASARAAADKEASWLLERGWPPCGQSSRRAGCGG